MLPGGRLNHVNPHESRNTPSTSIWAGNAGDDTTRKDPVGLKIPSVSPEGSVASPNWLVARTENVWVPFATGDVGVNVNGSPSSSSKAPSLATTPSFVQAPESRRHSTWETLETATGVGLR